MNNKQTLAFINLAGYLFLLAASFLFARSGNMFNTNSVMPLFMPAPYAFSIWLLIYILLGIWVVKGFFPSNFKQEQMYEAIGFWFFICMVLTGLTILVPVNVSPFFIIGALITSLIVYSIINKSDVSRLFRIPFSFLTAWLSVATIVNISLALKGMGITELFGIGEIGWTIILLAIGTLLAVVFTISQDDIIYSLVFIWGYIAIVVQNQSEDQVVKMALMMCVILAGAIGYNVYNRLAEKIS